MLTQEEAAGYCGVSVKTFKRACPAPPMLCSEEAKSLASAQYYSRRAKVKRGMKHVVKKIQDGEELRT